jgi:hypothetical protein
VRQRQKVQKVLPQSLSGASGKSTLVLAAVPNPARVASDGGTFGPNGREADAHSSTFQYVVAASTV